MSAVHYERWEFRAALVLGLFLSALVAGWLVFGSASTAGAQPAADCPGYDVVNGFVRVLPGQEQPDCREPVSAEGPDKLYGLHLPVDRYRMQPGGQQSGDVSVVYVVDRPQGDPLGPWVIAASIERSTGYSFPVALVNIRAADFLPVPGVWEENVIAHTIIARWIEPSGLYTLTVHTDLIDLSLEEIARLLYVLPPQAPLTGTGLRTEDGGASHPWLPIIGIGVGAVLVAALYVTQFTYRRGRSSGRVAQWAA